MTENAPAHTPDPWNITRKGYGYIDIRTPHKSSAEPNGQHVATVYQGPSIGGEEAEANARLLAAAPDLLAAAKRAVAALSIHGASNCEAAKECRAAIAKATGNSQNVPTPAPGTDATTADGRFVSGSGYGGERM